MEAKRSSSEQKKLRKNALQALGSLENEEISCLTMECAESAFTESSSVSEVYSIGKSAVFSNTHDFFLGELEDSLPMSDDVRNAVLCAAADTLKALKPNTIDAEEFVCDYFVYEVHKKLIELGLKLKNPNEKLHEESSFSDFVECIKNRFNPNEPDYAIARVLAEASDRGEMMGALQIANEIGINIRGSNTVSGRLRYLRRIFKIYGIEVAKERKNSLRGTAPMFYQFTR